MNQAAKEAGLLFLSSLLRSGGQLMFRSHGRRVVTHLGTSATGRTAPTDQPAALLANRSHRLK